MGLSHFKRGVGGSIIHKGGNKKHTRAVGAIPDIGGQYDEILKALEGVLKPMGPPGSGISRLGSDIAHARESSFAGNPLLKAYYDETMGGLNFEENGLPADFARTLTEGVRSSLAARGTIDSDTGAIEEAVALMGGREFIRNNRLNQANQLLTSGLLPTAGDFLPGASGFLSQQLGLEDLQMRRTLARKGMGSTRAGQQIQTGAAVGDLVGSVIGAAAAGG